MSDHFEKFVDHIIGDDDSELAKVRAERDYALHWLEREITIAQNAQSEIERLQSQLARLENVLVQAREYIDLHGEPSMLFKTNAMLAKIDLALSGEEGKK